jgi:C-terminal processing protease CtpA/Prc
MRSLGAFLCFVLFSASSSSQILPTQMEAVLDAIDKGVETEYYDPTVASSWRQIEREYETRILNAKSKQDAVDEIRRLLAELHNSHVLFYTREEWNLRQNVLPFTFEKLGERVFVRKPLQGDDLKFGDEIALVDGQPGSALEAGSLAKLSGISGNPLYGQPASEATLTVVSPRSARKVEVHRIKLDDISPIEVQKLSSKVVVIRFLSLPGDENEAAPLRESWATLLDVQGLVMDLRDCHGGWPSASSFILDSLLGMSRKDFKAFDRHDAEVPRSKSFAQAPRFTGKVTVVIGQGTQSECEVLAAGLKEAKRAVLVGTRTAGAFNGFTKAIPLPDRFALFALPYTRTLSPENKSYEGVGVAPDKVIANGVEDFHAGHDRVLEQAVRLVESAR